MIDGRLGDLRQGRIGGRTHKMSPSRKVAEIQEIELRAGPVMRWVIVQYQTHRVPGARLRPPQHELVDQEGSDFRLSPFYFMLSAHERPAP